MTLLEMKEKVEEAKRNKARYEGQLESIKERLKTEFSINSIEEAETKVIELEKTLSIKEAELKTGIAKLETDYNWN